MSARQLVARLAILTVTGLGAGSLTVTGTGGASAAVRSAAAPSAGSSGAGPAAGAPAPGEGGVTGTCASDSCRRARPASRDLRATQQAQLTGYFCGPATVTEMLAQMGTNVSQQKAAGELGTTSTGTGWSDLDSNPVPHALNRNQDRHDYVAVGVPSAPARAEIREFKNDLLADVNHGVPLAWDAYEVPDGPHLVGHPVNQAIFHWFDIRGYQNSGSTTDYEDSVHGASSVGWAATVPAYSSLPSVTIMNIIGARGYDW